MLNNLQAGDVVVVKLLDRLSIKHMICRQELITRDTGKIQVLISGTTKVPYFSTDFYLMDSKTFRGSVEKVKSDINTMGEDYEYALIISGNFITTTKSYATNSLDKFLGDFGKKSYRNTIVTDNIEVLVRFYKHR